MKISIVVWETDRKIVRITDKMSTLTVVKHIDYDKAFIKLPDVYLGRDETIVMATALTLAAKVARYLDEYAAMAAYDAILGLPTTPYDGWRPMPRAGRTENP